MSAKTICLCGIFAIAGLLFTSCEKIIDVDLNSADPKTVIEANLREGDHLFQVHVYQTKDYFSNDPTVYFDDASVRLSDDSGESTDLIPVGNGTYEVQMIAVAGKTYTLQVTRNGETFTASSTLPEVTTIKQITYKEVELPGEDDNQEVYLRFDDRAGEHNYYRILVTANDTLDYQLQYFDDKYFDGNDVQWSLNDFYSQGDRLNVELRSIDAAAYKYYLTLAPILTGNDDTAPGNPIGNWQGGALGYFIAYSSSRIDGVVP
ncbi:MAG: DUF4249 domain-containing protein [Lewinellaceae bacterium]|nr:DUF4249 domain-containing protein [Lewinellaceae bacterium]